jgi:hypothetical protein
MNKVTAVLDQIEAQQQSTAIPDDIPIMQIADAVVRGKLKLSQPQTRLLIELLPYHAPKLMAVANLQFNFAVELDKKILERSMKLIEAQPVPTQQSAEELKGPMSRLRRV